MSPEEQSPPLGNLPAKGATLAGQILKLAFFFALLGSAIALLHVLINFGLRRVETGDFGVSNKMVRGEINADIIISGSSRALVHYDAALIQAATGRTTFNIGVNGSQTDMQFAVLKTYLEHNRKPKLVIHNLDLFAFKTSRGISDPAQYLPYLDQPAIFAGVRRAYPEAWKWRYLPLYGYAVEDMRFQWTLGLGRLLGWQPRETRVQGYEARNWVWRDDFEKFKKAHPDGFNEVVEPDGIADLEKLMELCRAQEIPLLLVYSPEYYEVHALQLNRADIFALFRKLSATHQAQFWDYGDSALSRSKDNFYNSQHLNARAASSFSKDLAERLAQTKLISSP